MKSLWNLIQIPRVCVQCSNLLWHATPYHMQVFIDYLFWATPLRRQSAAICMRVVKFLDSYNNIKKASIFICLFYIKTAHQIKTQEKALGACRPA